jgi:hypothetical protein
MHTRAHTSTQARTASGRNRKRSCTHGRIQARKRAPRPARTQGNSRAQTQMRKHLRLGLEGAVGAVRPPRTARLPPPPGSKSRLRCVNSGQSCCSLVGRRLEREERNRGARAGGGGGWESAWYMAAWYWSMTSDCRLSAPARTSPPPSRNTFAPGQGCGHMACASRA